MSQNRTAIVSAFDARAFAASLQAAEQVPLRPEVRAIVEGARFLYEAYVGDRTATKDALARLTISSDNNRKLLAENEKLIERNYELTNTLERYESFYRRARVEAS